MMKREKEDGPPVSEELVHTVFRYFNKRLGHEYRAWDATGDTFEEVCRNWSKFNPRRGSFPGWVHGITKLVLLRHLEAAAREEVRRAGEVDPDDLGAADRRRQRISEPTINAMRALSDRDRGLVYLSAVVGTSTKDIASALGMTQTAVTSALSRAYRRMRMDLEQP